MARRSHRRVRRHRRHVNPISASHRVRRHRRHHFRRNPSLGGVKGIVRATVQQAIGGIVIVGAKIATRKVGNFLPASMRTGLIGLASGAVVSTGLGMAAEKLIGPKWGGYVGAGSWASLWEAMAVAYKDKLPAFVSSGLAGYVPLSGYTPLSGDRYDQRLLSPGTQVPTGEVELSAALM